MSEPYPAGAELPSQSEQLTEFANATFTRHASWEPGSFADVGIGYQQSSDPNSGVLTRTVHYSPDLDNNPLKYSEDKSPYTMLSAIGHPDRPAETTYRATVGDMNVAWEANTQPLVEDTAGNGVAIDAERFADMQAELSAALYIPDYGLMQRLAEITPAMLKTPSRVRQIMGRILGALEKTAPTIKTSPAAGTINYEGVEAIRQLSEQ